MCKVHERGEKLSQVSTEKKKKHMVCNFFHGWALTNTSLYAQMEGTGLL